MPLGFLRALSGNEVKVFMAIIFYSDKNHEYANIENLMDFNLSYPTVVKVVAGLEKKGCIKKFDTGGKLILRVSPEYFEVSMHIKKCPNQLLLLPEDDIDEPKKWRTKKDQDALIRHYALERGVPVDKLSDWYKSDYKKNIEAAQFILDYCLDISQAKGAITNCRIDREKQKLNWSLAGDVRRNIQDYVPKCIEGKERKWH